MVVRENGRNTCRTCNAARKLSKTSGLSFEEILAHPRGTKCDICGYEPKGTGESHDTLHLDHCHTSNKIRGWLCSRCNRGIGLLGDSVESIEMVLDYLRAAER